MAKLAQNVAKYNVIAQLEANGIVEKPDVIGAVFGQTEGLLGADLDLRELQRTGRIGRIEVEIKNQKGKSTGSIIIPSSLDAAETSLIAASLETIERVGPCDANITVDKVQDLRDFKRNYVVERAKELLTSLSDRSIEAEEISEKIKEAVRVQEIVELYGVPAGPGVKENDTMILCEGRADVLNLLRHGIKNAIAVGGTAVNIPDQIRKLTKEKTTVAFLDGDRGGDLILKELQQTGVELDFVSRAPEGKEVEELTKKEVFKSLREKVPIDQVKYISESHQDKSDRDRRDRRHDKRHDNRRDRRDQRDQRDNRDRRDSDKKEGFFKKKRNNVSDEEKEKFSSTLQDIIGTHAVCLFNKDMEILGRIPSSELDNALKQVRNIYAVVIDETADKNLIKKLERYDIKIVVANETEGSIRTNITILTQDELGDVAASQK